MYKDEDTVELDYSYEESEEEEPQPKRARYRQVVLRSPDDLPEEMRRGDGSQPQELESDAGQPEGMERVEDSPAAAVVATSGNHCPAVGCSYEGDSEARIAHWRGSHLPELPLWLCPVGRCSHKCRSREALLSHLSGKRHKYSASTSERLMELPPLVETVINNRFQAPGDVVPLVGPEEIPAGALPFQHKADLGPRVSEIFKTKNVGKILLPIPSAEAFQIGDWVGFLGLPPPPPPPLPYMDLPAKPMDVAAIPLPPLPPPPPEDIVTIPDHGPPTEGDEGPPSAPPAGPEDVAPPASPAGTGEDPPPAPPAGPEDVTPPAPPAGTDEGPPPAPPAGPEDVTPPAPPAGTGEGPPPAPPAGPEDVTPPAPPAGPEDVTPPAPPAGPDAPAHTPPAERDDLPTVMEGNQDTLLPSPSATVACPGKGAPNAAAALVGLQPPPPPPDGTAAVHGPPQPHYPLTASALRTQVRRLDVQLDQMQRQRHDLMEAAFYAMKKDVQRLEEENSVLRQRSAFLELQLRGCESRAEYVPDPHQVGQLQRVCSCRSHLLVPAAGRTAVYSMDTRDLALLDVSTRSEELSCDPL